ncbi:flavin reductase family protein [Halobacillus halophilus]|uniref:flavin reductase family protein n=1 Tax=Halobacillus halophilus TaxID=1570 RepID=UPI001CD326B4|nr:flavin reductase family protein [Halobacillus halophilus]MCA1012478.1 flavin reductase family protein [Halobacillus halophilus]
MLIHKDQFKDHNMSKLIKGAVVPRPIAWVSTESEDGVGNLAPFSFFTVASMDPITLCFSVGSVEREKDTLTNIKETGQFVVNIVSESLANQMHESSKAHPRETNEFIQAGTSTERAAYVKAPLVTDAPVSMECELDRIIDLGLNQLILGKVVGYHVREEVYMETDKIDPYKLKPVGRMAGDYSYIREFYKLPNENLPE